MKKILMFHMDLDRARQARKVCDRIGAEAVEISRSDYCQELGYLAGIIGFEKKKEIYMGPELAGEMLVLSGLDDRGIDAFLAAWKEQGAAAGFPESGSDTKQYSLDAAGSVRGAAAGARPDALIKFSNKENRKDSCFPFLFSVLYCGRTGKTL